MKEILFVILGASALVLTYILGHKAGLKKGAWIATSMLRRSRKEEDEDAG